MKRPAQLLCSLAWMVLLALPAGAMQHRDPLTEAETDQLREAALEPQLKLKLLIKFALKKSGGNQTKAARFLKTSRDTLRYRMKKFGLGENKEDEPEPGSVTPDAGSKMTLPNLEFS